jgi:uncharacterized membrane protein YcaP (DUF421 family)
MAADLQAIAVQSSLAAVYYAGVVLITRLAGKRLAGQVATYDLIVLISMGVVLQSALLREGPGNAATFVFTVFICHKLLAALCFRSGTLRALVRGKPRVLVRSGSVVERSLQAEGMSLEELRAGLRKLGHESLETVELATLEENGEISAVDSRREA